MDDDSDAATLTSDRPIRSRARSLQCCKFARLPVYVSDVGRSMTLKAGDGGYGFTLQGSAPVVVQRVEAGSVAEKAGLRGGDVIMEVTLVLTVSISFSVNRLSYLFIRMSVCLFVYQDVRLSV